MTPDPLGFLWIELDSVHVVSEPPRFLEKESASGAELKQGSGRPNALDTVESLPCRPSVDILETKLRLGIGGRIVVCVAVYHLVCAWRRCGIYQMSVTS